MCGDTVSRSLGVSKFSEDRLTLFWGKVDIGPKFIPEGTLGACWLWRGGTDKSGRYGVFWDGARTTPAHTYAYESVNGDLPRHMTLDHLCRMTLCVRPDHLEPVTRNANSRRRSRDGIRRTR